jgi:hypothetical protein
MNIAQIEINLQKLFKSYSKKTFIYDLLLAYGLPKASITRLRRGNLNLSDINGELSWKKKVLFREVYDLDLHIVVSEMAAQIKHNQRFVIVTDYKLFLAIDTKTQDKLDVDLKDLPKHFDFFLPWAGMEKAQHADENPADVKAAERMAKLYDEIKKDNSDDTPEFNHGLNVFLSRLLFCFFAEDTNIFQSGQFTNGISSYTQVDGSDLHNYINNLFQVMNTPEKKRAKLPAYLSAFPYVNGGLFSKRLIAPIFTRRSRQAIIDSGELDWSEINPDIFGSMIQAVITPEHRGGLGMHYTSVPNIMKVIEPLFLNNLREEYEKRKSNPQKLNELLFRMGRIKIFDPACGSGNFLIIAYKELRKLEIQIIHRMEVMQTEAISFGLKAEQQTFIPKSQLAISTSFQIELFSRIQLSQFYGIELDDFAHEIAQLSLWLAEHQMNMAFKKEFGQASPTLPLKEAGQIVRGNACRLDWDMVCPKKKKDEIYILGNPPYYGSNRQTDDQKEDLKTVFRGESNFKNLDYIACWFKKAAEYETSNNIQFAFVSTNSICQGEQVLMLWPHIFCGDMEIGFCHKPFLWNNSAKGKAAVYCIIIGIRKTSTSPKAIYNGTVKQVVENINPYLVPSKRNLILSKRKNPLSSFLPQMVYGSKPTDGGHLILTDTEKEKIERSYPEASKWLKKYVGASEFTAGYYRWCLWIPENEKDEAYQIEPIKNAIEKVREFRLSSKKKATQKLGSSPHKFGEIRFQDTDSILCVESDQFGSFDLNK